MPVSVSVPRLGVSFRWPRRCVSLYLLLVEVAWGVGLCSSQRLRLSSVHLCALLALPFRAWPSLSLPHLDAVACIVVGRHLQLRDASQSVADLDGDLRQPACLTDCTVRVVVNGNGHGLLQAEPVSESDGAAGGKG